MASHKHAIVIGGSMAGLVGGRILADHFESVTILERDRFPDGPESRKGVSQDKHPHILLVRGARILEVLFPGLQAEMTAAGAPLVDWGQDLLWYTAAGPWPHTKSDMISTSSSRPFIEWHVRQRLAAHPRVRFCEEHDATGLLSGDSGRAVAGVRVRRRGHGGVDQKSEEMQADLVVDASGRTSRAPDWLAELGYTRPEETVVNSFLGYATRMFQPRADFEHDWKVVGVLPQPPALARGGVIIPVEDGRWMITLSGAARDYPPTDEEGFKAFAASLASPVVLEAIRNAEPLSPIVAYQRTENRWRHYERLDRWPERFVALGDAACAFNPVYGQGISAAAMAAELLDALLAEHARRRGSDLTGLGRRYQRELARLNANIWMMASAEDYRYPTTEGPRPPAITRLAQRYLDQVMLLAAGDSRYSLLLGRVIHFVEPASALYKPWVAGRVLPLLLDRGRPAGEDKRISHG